MAQFFLTYCNIFPPLVVCVMGMFRENATQTCRPCEIGKYKNTTGDQACHTCPPKYTTMQTGSISCGKEN